MGVSVGLVVVRRLAQRSAVCLLALAGGGLPAAAQGDVPGQDVPTIEDVRGRLAELEASSAEGAAEKAELYRQAVAALEQAEGARERAARFEEDRAEAPGLLETLRRELAGPPEEPGLSASPTATSQELESRLQQARAALTSSRELSEELTRLGEHRSTRASELPSEITAASRALRATEEALEAAATGPEAAAWRALLLAQIEEHGARLAALEAEQAAYDARREVLPLRRDRARHALARAERAVDFWKERVEERRTAEAEEAAREARAQAQETARRFPALAEVAERNRELATLRTGSEGLTQRISRVRDGLEAAREQLEETERRYRAARRRIAAGGLTEGMGLILRRDYEWLPREAVLETQREVRQERLSRAQLELIVLEEERVEAGDVSMALEDLLAELDIDSPPTPLVETARELLLARRTALNAALEDLTTLTSTYYELEDVARQLSRTVEAYRGFIEKRILWVPSTPPNPLESVTALPAHVAELSAAISWETVLVGIQRCAREHPFSMGSTGLLLLAVAFARSYLRRKRAEMGRRVRSYRTDKYVYTLRALVQTFLLALFFPLAAWTLGWLLSFSTVELEKAAGLGLRETARTWLVLRFLRGLLVEKGAGAAHFRWPASSLAAVRRELRWFEPLAVGLGFVVHTLERQSVHDWSDSVGRGCFIASMAALACFSHRLLREESDLWAAAPKGGTGLLGKTHRVWSLTSTGLPVALALLAASGYYYTALQFELRLRYSIAFAFGVVLINALLLRWLFKVRRQLAVSQSLEARAKKEEEEDAKEEGPTESGGAPIDGDKIDIPAVDARTRELFKSSITLATVVGLYLIWASVLPALQGLDRVQLLPELRVLAADPEAAAAAPVGATAAGARADDAGRNGTANGASGGGPSPIEALPLPDGAPPAEEESGSALGLPAALTLADALLALVFVLLTSVAAKNLPALLELSLLQRLPLDSGARYAVATIVRYLILIAGVSAVSGALGIGWRQVQWLAAALTFGLAFGLQEIFANFVSGLIILLERPIRVGDIVTVGGTEGRVTQLRMRATTIQDWDRREFLIPNKEFITGSVINWTLTDPVNRVVIPVGIAYGSDTAKARRLLVEAAKQHPQVLEDPAPQAIFRAFGESSLDFELRAFLGNRDYWPQVIDGLHTQIDEAFRAAGVEIAFPQRDLHLRSLPPGTGPDGGALPLGEVDAD